MSKSSFRSAVFGIIFTLSLYIMTLLVHMDQWGNIASSCCSIYGSMILFWRYFRFDRSSLISKSWLLYALALLAWGMADIDWTILYAKGINPIDNTLNIILYFFTNFFFLCAVLLFAFTYFKKWNGLQLILDTVVISVLCLLLVWVLFLDKQSEIIRFIFQDGFFSFSSILIDICVLIGVFVFYLSLRSGKIPRYLRIVSTGVSLFCTIDLIYYYSYYMNRYLPNTLIDLFYLFSLLLIAFGALLSSKNAQSFSQQIYISNIGTSKKALYLALFPFFTLFSQNCRAFDILAMGLVILSYELITKQIQNAIENVIKLQEELVLNKELEEQILLKSTELEIISNLDTVTKLYNRTYFRHSLQNALEQISPKEIIAVLFMDLDRFKTINGTYGHDTGDRVLIEIAERLQKWNSLRLIIARIGGDEFALLMNGKYSELQVEEIATRIRSLCSVPVSIDDHTLYITVSIGIAVAPADSSDSVTLMKYADMAMYRAKSVGYNQYKFYNQSIGQLIHRKHKIELLLQKSDINKDFDLYYQPQFDLANNQLIGMEALIRWNTESFGYISPGEFIPIAEEINFISKLGKWIFWNACRQIREWNKTYGTNLKIGINMSPKELVGSQFVSGLTGLIADNPELKNWIDIEITENIMLEQNEAVQLAFSTIHELGITISIDDFGTGYASFKYLQRYPFNRIKIDKSLIDNITADENSFHIASAIINMSKTIGLKTIAEGVETAEQSKVLNELGCDQVQGFLFGLPVAPKDFEQRYLKQKHPFRHPDHNKT